MRILPSALLSLSLTGCAVSHQSALDPASFQANRITGLWWFFAALLGAIFVFVIALTLRPLWRRHRGINQEPLEQTHEPSRETERNLGRVVGAATAATVLILLALTVMSVITGRATAGNTAPGRHLAIEITGNQWWWSVRYLNDDPSRIVVTANELHVPVGEPVLIRGLSNDVIHSFWVPNLQGKRDLIPSRVTTEWFEADRPGRYRGQCAEFCGLQHAHMSLWVIAEPRDQFDAWMARQLQPAPPPSTPDAQRGQRVFLNNACVLCHSIQGTAAAGQVGPDLTHLASRLAIAAGTLPNNKGNLAGWISDPQGIKPGNHMAVVPIAPEDMQPLVDYLETLQ